MKACVLQIPITAERERERRLSYQYRHALDIDAPSTNANANANATAHMHDLRASLSVLVGVNSIVSTYPHTVVLDMPVPDWELFFGAPMFSS